MTTITSNAFTFDDLEAMPDDGKRYELIGGAIVRTPAPEPIHQRTAQRPVDIDWPVRVSFSVGDLARRRAE